LFTKTSEFHARGILLFSSALRYMGNSCGPDHRPSVVAYGQAATSYSAPTVLAAAPAALAEVATHSGCNSYGGVIFPSVGFQVQNTIVTFMSRRA
jgi:hypothetical protein